MSDTSAKDPKRSAAFLDCLAQSIKRPQAKHPALIVDRRLRKRYKDRNSDDAQSTEELLGRFRVKCGVS